MTCKECLEEYDERNPKHRGGHYSICGDCEDKRVVDGNKTIGFFDVSGKSEYRMELIRNPSVSEKQMVKRMGRCGPSHCHTSLGLSSNGANTSKDKMDTVHSSLYETTHD